MSVNDLSKCQSNAPNKDPKVERVRREIFPVVVDTTFIEIQKVGVGNDPDFIVKESAEVIRRARCGEVDLAVEVAREVARSSGAVVYVIRGENFAVVQTVL